MRRSASTPLNLAKRWGTESEHTTFVVLHPAELEALHEIDYDLSDKIHAHSTERTSFPNEVKQLGWEIANACASLLRRTGQGALNLALFLREQEARLQTRTKNVTHNDGQSKDGTLHTLPILGSKYKRVRDNSKAVQKRSLDDGSHSDDRNEKYRERAIITSGRCWTISARIPYRSTRTHRLLAFSSSLLCTKQSDFTQVRQQCATMHHLATDDRHLGNDQARKGHLMRRLHDLDWLRPATICILRGLRRSQNSSSSHLLCRLFHNYSVLFSRVGNIAPSCLVLWL